VARSSTRSRHETAGGPGDLGEAHGGRVPPHDLEAEKAVLSALLLDNAAVHSAFIEVRPEDFYHPSHRALYAAMVALRDENEPVDLHTLSDYLTRQKLLDRVGGPVALAEIADYETTAAHVVHHARIVRDKAIKRRLIATATEIVEVGYDEGDRADRLLDHAESKIFEISRENARSTFRRLDSEIHSTFDYLDALRERGGELTGVPSGFRELDKLTGGLQKGELVILAARPSMGKTALALNLARHASAVDKTVAFFSLEMSAQALVLRLLSSEGRVEASVFRSGNFASHSYQQLRQAAGRLYQAKILIDDSGSLTILEMKAKCRRLKSEGGLDLVMVDYLQLMRGEARLDSREQEIAEISRGLKALAKELEIPVVALAQLNRGPETREDKRPRLADLRESGAIEQDADVIAFLYRDEVYNPNDPQVQGLAELIVQKQRNGPTGTVHLQFESRYTRFNDLARQEEDAAPPFRGGGFAPPSGDDGDVF